MFMILGGCFLVALGIRVFSASDLVLGGTAGISIVLHHITGLSFGVLFFLINFPFYWLSIKQLGMGFTLKTFMSVTLLSLLSDGLTALLDFPIIHSFFGAIIGGVLIGFGLILLFRSNSSLGGINILAMFLSRRHGINPGKTIMITDICIVCSALLVFDYIQILYSVVAIMVMSVVLGRYHKKSPIEKNNKLIGEMERENEASGLGQSIIP
ncbi:YitT family protein [Aneurinibacillus aneurinilyticus]|uniref:YitT family protein n=2 Tax=Aneurinibacillus aneurinilyticus TaxID=1391 RepID=A0A848D2X0_ANEAE|nr:YitT family protein [Aneurinibacillus aneurinilyticus]MED0673127.1 YitT family protein [Aneurinibacillus aneurinilyticus]NMF00433.1 YitT family protein [Aneurinibacillus aneurinilyticus]